MSTHLPRLAWPSCQQLIFKNSRCQPTCLDLPSAAASSLHFKNSKCQPTCLDLPSPAARSMYFRNSRCPPTCLDLRGPAASGLYFRNSRCQPTCLDLPSPEMHQQIVFAGFDWPPKPIKNNVWGPRAGINSSIFEWIKLGGNSDVIGY